MEVHSVNLHARDNAQSHNTRLYELLDLPEPPLVLRRSHFFFVTIRFKSDFNPQQHKVRIYLEYGPPPHRIQKGTLVVLPLKYNSTFTRDKETWDIRVQKLEKSLVTVDIKIPASVAVGEWKMKISSQVVGGNFADPFVFKVPQSIYILFNPWSKYDAVYLEDEDKRREFVLNDTGKIYRGVATSFKGRPWYYSQFTDVALFVTLELLKRSKLDSTGRASPILVCRAISKLVNSNDDRGIVVGNWSGDYEGGVAPWDWLGSFEILQEYYKSGCKIPVKYGQCWVFAGVTTTVCRTLGVPCRTVTNFSSAHDSNENLTIDRYFNEEGEMIDQEGIWNFHVWNDCWMARPDLPAGFEGWQTIDATPQETSDDKFQLGPASVAAIRLGQVGFNYDCRFVFAEVNADIIKWVRDLKSESGWRKISINKVDVGQLILTQKVGVMDYYGDKDADNITGEYKPKEGTEEERMVVMNAARYGVASRNRTPADDKPPAELQDVSFDIQDIEQVTIGQPFSVTMKVKNNSKEKRTVKATLSASTIYYTGVTAHDVSSKKDNFTLEPNQDQEMTFIVTADEYLDKLVTYCMMKIYTFATVEETRQTSAKEHDFEFKKPSLILEMPENLKVGELFKLTVNFTNPLKRRLTDCKFTMKAPGLRQPRKANFRDIRPEESINYTEAFTPKKHGSEVVTVNFSAKELIEVLVCKQANISG